jgi:signal transduction histidine kinase/ActR/RegA family two-component response regulator
LRLKTDRPLVSRLLLPAIFGSTTVIAALILWQLLLIHRRAEIEAATREEALFVKTKTESELRARILPLERLAGDWQAGPGKQDMESDASLVMSGYPAYQAIEWVDPTFHVVWITPKVGNQADTRAAHGVDEAQRAMLEDAAERGSTVVMTSSDDLPRGGRGFWVFVPVHSNKELSGFLVGVFQYQELLSSILQGVAPDYWVAVYDGDEEIYSRPSAKPLREGRYVQEANITFGQLNWRVRAWPKSGAVAYIRSPLPMLVFGLGSLVAVVLAFAVYMAESSRLHVGQLAATNLELEKEIAGREQAEQALRQAQKMEAVGRLAGGVAHDFNNLLMIIRGQAALSLNAVSPDAPLRRELAEIVKAADRASSLTRKLLAFGRKQVLQERVLDLNALVTQLVEMLPSVLGDDISQRIDLDPGLGRVKADSAQLEQVIMNLVFNARDAMPQGGELTIETENCELNEAWVSSHPGVRVGAYVLLRVRDTGHGMDRETQSHLFEPFFTTKDKSKGTGLGLATVYGTVKQSGGHVAVSSTLGAGTTIQIYLPRVQELVEVPEAPKPLVRSLDGEGRILVVEDDDAVRRMTRKFLEIRGYTVIEARCAADAIQFVERQDETIDLVLTDVVMPGMKGRELVDQLDRLRPSLKVLYMSAYTEDDAISIGVLSPGTTFIEKPFSPDELAAKVRDLLNSDRSNVSAQRLRRGAKA